jgi:hypothetical protein
MRRWFDDDQRKDLPDAVAEATNHERVAEQASCSMRLIGPTWSKVGMVLLWNSSRSTEQFIGL